MSAELAARRTAAAAVLADYRAAMASAPLSKPPGREWMLRLASVLDDLLTAPAAGDEDLDDEDLDDDGTEPYCADCGAWTGMFYGMDGWHHFRGDPAPGGQRELYDAGHEATVAWCTPPGRAVSPADAAIIARALKDAETFRMREAAEFCADCEAHPAGACDDHLDDVDAAQAYHDLAGMFGGAR